MPGRFPVDESAAVARIGEATAAVAPAAAAGIAEAAATAAAVGPAPATTVAPSGDLQVSIAVAVEELLPATGLITGAGDPRFDAVVRFLVCVGAGLGDGAEGAPGAEQRQYSKQGGGFHGM